MMPFEATGVDHVDHPWMLLKNICTCLSSVEIFREFDDDCYGH